MKTTIIILFVLNALAHIISFRKLKAENSPNALGVGGFVAINLAMAIFIGMDVAWAKWPAIIFPTMGGLGLILTTLIKGKGGWIDYFILVLDIALVTLLLFNYF